MTKRETSEEGGVLSAEELYHYEAQEARAAPPLITALALLTAHVRQADLLRA